MKNQELLNELSLIIANCNDKKICSDCWCGGKGKAQDIIDYVIGPKVATKIINQLLDILSKSSLPLEEYLDIETKAIEIEKEYYHNGE